MKNKKLLIVLILIISNFSFLFQNNNTITIIREQKNKDDNESNLAISNSIVYDWNTIWDGGYDDYAAAIALDSSGNIYLVGITTDISMDSDICLVKFNSSGDYQWNSTWDGSPDDRAIEIAIDSSGNIYLVGVTYNAISSYDICLVKFNSSGDYQWNRTWDRGINGEDWGYAIALDSSDNIYITGWSYNMLGNDDMCLLKFNNAGDYQWNRTWDGGVNDHDWGHGIALDSSGNIYLVGSTSNTGTDFCVVKFSSSGDYQWNSTWHGGIDDFAYDIALDSSDNIYIVGYTYNGTSDDITLVKFDNSGYYQWYSIWDGGINDDDWGYGIALDSSDNIYCAGVTYNVLGNGDMGLIKFNSTGDYQWNRTWDRGVNDDDLAYEIVLDSSENVYLAGWSYNMLGNSDMCMVKYNSAPKIKINTPIQNNYYGIFAPSYNIAILESELNSSWYSLDGGMTNISLSGLEGIISQEEWDKKDDGLVTINFYANDSMGLEGTSVISVNKDITAPTSSITFTPHSGTDIVNKSTTFSLTADDGQGSGVASIMYKINDGNWINYVNPFNLSDYKTGNFNISYYSIDKVNNIENINSLLVKIPGRVAIPGYNILLFMSLLCVISIISFKLRTKKLNK